MLLLIVPYLESVHVMQDLGCVVSAKLEIRFEGNLLPHALVPAGHAHSFLHTLEIIVRAVHLISQISRF